MVWLVKINPDVSFPTNNEWGVPVLSLDYCPGVLVEPFLPWGCVSRKKPMYGTWHFYVQDYKFEALWTNPPGIILSQPSIIVEPNFSIAPECAKATAIYQIYRKRFLSRFWQSKGIFTLVDLNVPQKFSDLNLLGVPKGWSAFATRGDRKNIDKLYLDWELSKKKSGVINPLFLVYSGGVNVENICLNMGWFYFDTYRG